MTAVRRVPSSILEIPQRFPKKTDLYTEISNTKGRAVG